MNSDNKEKDLFSSIRERTDSTILKIHHNQSLPTSNFSIGFPFLITYEVCSGLSDGDYMNCVSMSNSGLNYGTFPVVRYQMLTEQLRHRHDYYELSYVMEGSIIQKIENNSYRYTEGTGCLLNKNIYHCEELCGPCRLLFIGISSALVYELAEMLGKGNSYEKHLADSLLFQFMANNQLATRKEYLDLFPAYHHQQASLSVDKLVEYMLQVCLFQGCGSTYIAAGLICSLLGILSDEDQYHTTQINLDSKADFLLFSRITYLLREANGRLSRSELEKELHYSGNYLNRVVHKYTDMSLFEYSMTICMEKAAWFLLHSNLSVAEVMNELHFTNANHFYAQFEKQYGMTPAKYRKSHPRPAEEAKGKYARSAAFSP